MGAFIYLHLANQSGIARHIQSVTIGTGLLVVGAFILLFGFSADIANKHRQLTHLALYKLRNLEYRLFASDEGVTVRQVVSAQPDPIHSDSAQTVGRI